MSIKRMMKYFIGIALILNSVMLTGAIPANERAALIALYTSTNGDNWEYNWGWKTPPLDSDGFAMPGTEDKWLGVFITNDHVTGLEIPWNQMSGTLPPELGNLSYLVHIDLTENDLTGTIPTELSKLTQLEYLDLGGNQLEGSIIPELGNLINLKTLRLSANQLSGTIPEELLKLTKIETLHLGYNNLNGVIPIWLSNLTTLKSLSLTKNKFTGTIPPVFGTFPNLEVLELGYNQLNGTIPPELGNLSKLTRLYLPKSNLNGAIPSALGNLSNLKELGLSDNYLTGTIPPELGKLGNLESLFLSFNLLSGSLPPELGNLQNLNNLQFEVNKLSGSIPPEFGKLTKLTSLNARANLLTGSIPQEIGNMTSLKFIYLSDNQLSGTIPSQLGKLSALWELQLDNNQLSGSIPPELGNLSNLRTLFLNKNKLSGAIPVELGKLVLLTSFALFDNQLSGSIPSEFGNLTAMQTLSLSNNQLTGAIPKSFGNLSDLRNLSLTGNLLNGTIPTELSKIPFLYQLDLSHNQLTGSIPTELCQLKNLENLYLDSNQLSGSIPSQINHLKYLQHLTFESNEFSNTIPEELGDILSLRELSLGHNHLSGAIPPGLTKLTNLKTFNIGYNCLYTTDTTVRNWLVKYEPAWEIYQNQCGSTIPIIYLNRHRLNFGAISKGTAPATQTVMIMNNGKGVMNWNAVYNANWISLNPSSGTQGSILSVSVNPASLEPGNYSDTILITDSSAFNSPQSIEVFLHVYEQGKTSEPIGAFYTPVYGATVANSIPVTGFALDDVGISSVKIYNDSTYVGDAVFVEGARPDIENEYIDYPNCYKAGWGYMLLTHFLPNGGNGVYTLTAKATDMEGNEKVLGSKTIIIDNANSTKPFGAIDTPTQGGTISGKEFVNFGWALTPQPNMVPIDGATIDVVIDGVVKGHPGYNAFRSDIAELFPSYTNAQGAGGYYYLDTTQLTNGLHTISWNVTDSAGNTDGIGSRYFTVMNTGITNVSDDMSSRFFQGPDTNKFSWNEADAVHIDIKELERIEFLISEGFCLSRSTQGTDENNLNSKLITQNSKLENAPLYNITGYMIVGNELKELPIGSFLDTRRGVFYWQPGPGFVGQYRFVFFQTDESGRMMKNKCVLIHIQAKH